MFESLSERITQSIRKLKGVANLSEENMSEALQEIRTALLSADVHFKVARDFIENVKNACVGQEVIKSISPGQQIIKIINDELIKILGEGSTALSENKPLKIMMVGLHGSGKTTSSVKLASYLKTKGYKPSLVACDVYRPAAIDQLESLAKNEHFPVFTNRNSKDVPKIGKQALKWREEQESDAIIFDTAGRLQIDENLIKELEKLKNIIEPDEVFLVADSALGQEAVNVAKHFHDSVALTGIVLTKLDGDARGGAALSMKSITEVPIKFIGTGEKINNFDIFHPERMARRILGMGDVVSLVEKAQASIDKKEADRLAEKVKKAEFNLDDFLLQIRQIKKMGSVASLAKMIPGMGNAKIGGKEEKQLLHTEALILSMTPQERTNPKIINGSRRLRIAEGAGLTVRELNILLKQFQQMRKIMKSMKGAKGKKLQQQLSNMPGFGDLSKLSF